MSMTKVILSYNRTATLSFIQRYIDLTSELQKQFYINKQKWLCQEFLLPIFTELSWLSLILIHQRANPMSLAIWNKCKIASQMFVIWEKNLKILEKNRTMMNLWVYLLYSKIVTFQKQYIWVIQHILRFYTNQNG